LSGQDGLDHYHKLFRQIKLLVASYGLPVTAILEISPEQKPLIIKSAKSQFPNAKISLRKDLADKWRLLILKIG
jgi:methylase of polypeptide subunit release factors